MKLLRQFDHLCAAIERTAVVVIFAALVMLLFLNIVFRSLLGISFHAILEFVPAIVLWLALIGATVALRQGRHIKIELLLRFCSPTIRRVARRASNAFGMIVMGILFCASIEFFRNEIAMFGPAGGSALILPVFFSLAFLRFLVATIDPDNPSPAPMGDPDEGSRP